MCGWHDFMVGGVEGGWGARELTMLKKDQIIKSFPQINETSSCSFRKKVERRSRIELGDCKNVIVLRLQTQQPPCRSEPWNQPRRLLLALASEPRIISAATIDRAASCIRHTRYKRVWIK